MGDALTEWLALGLLLQQLRPDRFEEVLVALRDSVGLHQIHAASTWACSEVDRVPPKA
jgi:hypothetical protein